MADSPALHFCALFDLRLNSDSGLVKCDGLLAVAVDRMAKRLTVIGVNLDPVARAADRDVKLLSIDEFSRPKRIDIDDDPIDRRPLARMRG